MPLHRVWEYRDIGRLFIIVGGKRVIIGVLRWGWVEVILRVSLEVILRKLLRQGGSGRRPRRTADRRGGPVVGRSADRGGGRSGWLEGHTAHARRSCE